MSQQTIAILVIAYVAITLAAPALLARPTLIYKHPRAVLVWWFIFLLLAAASLITALIGLVIRALMHHVTHIEGHGVLMPILDNVFGWLALAVLGLLIFRLGAAVSDQKAMRREQNARLEMVTELSEHRELYGVNTYIVESPEIIISTVPSVQGVIISHAVLERLSPKELEAALTHEKAHLDGHHNRLRELGAIMVAVAPGFSATNRMAQATRIATELMADDVAAGVCGKENVAGALTKAYADKDLVQERILRLTA